VTGCAGKATGCLTSTASSILKVDGFVANGFRPAGPGVPADEARVRDVLRNEGVAIDAQGRASEHQRFRLEDWR